MDSKLLNLLCCPESGAKLVLNKSKTELICKKSKLAYPIKDGVPVLLRKAARSIENSDTKKGEPSE